MNFNGTKYPFDVVYEDNHLIVINKEAGLLVQGDKTKDQSLPDYVKQYLKEKHNKPGAVFCGVIHRLDRPVSGLVVLAKTSKALERMNKLVRTRDFYKTYWAIVKKCPYPKEARLTHWLIKDGSKNTSTAYDEDPGGAKKSELSYKAIGKLNDHWLVEVRPTTGRPHQIRVQLAKIGCPIRGDVRYGFKKLNPDRKSINLHAKELHFIHPVKKESMHFKAPLPDDEFWQQYGTLDSIKNREIKEVLK
jgi:23S rRNA pseudouridine1911/1915/1917 synthase